MHILLSSLFLLMKHPVTIVQQVEAMDGREKANGHHTVVSVCGVNSLFLQAVIFSTSYDLTYNYSLLPAPSLNGILCLGVIEGFFNATHFAQFIDGLLYVMNPYPGPNSMVVVDNCSIHEDQTIIEMNEEW